MTTTWILGLWPLWSPVILESFRFEDNNDYEYEILLKVFCVLSKNRHPPPDCFIVPFFTKKVSTVIFINGG